MDSFFNEIKECESAFPITVKHMENEDVYPFIFHVSSNIAQLGFLRDVTLGEYLKQEVDFTDVPIPTIGNMKEDASLGTEVITDRLMRLDMLMNKYTRGLPIEFNKYNFDYHKYEADAYSKIKVTFIDNNTDPSRYFFMYDYLKRKKGLEDNEDDFI